MGSARNGRKGETKGTRREGGMEGGRKERRVAVKRIQELPTDNT